MELGRLWGQALSLNLGHLVMPTFDTATLSLNLGHLVVPTFDTATLSLNLGHLVVPTLDTASPSLNLGHLVLPTFDTVTKATGIPIPTCFNSRKVKTNTIRTVILSAGSN